MIPVMSISSTTLRYALFFLTAYLIALLVSLPAEQVYRAARQTGSLPVELYGISGTSWHGRARTMLIEGIQVQDVEWRLKPLSLIIGRAELAVSLRIGQGSANGVAGRTLRGAWYARDVRIDAGLADLSSAAGLDAGLRGRIAGTIAQARIAGGQVRALDGEVEITGVAIDEPLNMNLGSFSVNAETRDDGIHAALADREGALRAQGSAVLQPTGEWRARLRLAPRNEADAGTRDMLRMLGRPDAEGYVEVVRSGTLPLDRFIR
jgi:general secretion pathway protein N